MISTNSSQDQVSIRAHLTKTKFQTCAPLPHKVVIEEVLNIFNEQLNHNNMNVVLTNEWISLFPQNSSNLFHFIGPKEIKKTDEVRSPRYCFPKCRRLF